MGKRGPRPKGESNIIKFKTGIVLKRPAPGAGMTQRSRNLFKKIVASKPPGTYSPESVVLLRSFCEFEESHYKATKALEKEGAVITVSTRYGVMQRKNPWVDIQKDSAAMMSSLSTKLRAMAPSKSPAPSGPNRVMFKPHTD